MLSLILPPQPLRIKQDIPFPLSLGRGRVGRHPARIYSRWDMGNGIGLPPLLIPLPLAPSLQGRENGVKAKALQYNKNIYKLITFCR
jgi:hypothetical protein